MEHQYDAEIAQERLERAIQGEQFDLVDQEKVGLRWAWRIYYLATLIGLGFYFVLPTYSCITGIFGFIYSVIVLKISPTTRLRTHFDDDWRIKLYTVDYPLDLINTSIGGCRFSHDYAALPWVRRTADNIIIAPLKWPWFPRDIKKYRGLST